MWKSELLHAYEQEQTNTYNRKRVSKVNSTQGCCDTHCYRKVLTDSLLVKINKQRERETSDPEVVPGADLLCTGIRCQNQE